MLGVGNFTKNGPSYFHEQDGTTCCYVCASCCGWQSYPVDLLLVIPDVDVRVLQGLGGGDPLLWIHHQHLGQQIPSHAGPQSRVLLAVLRENDVRKEFLKVVPSIAGAVLHVITHSGLQPLHKLSRRGS